MVVWEKHLSEHEVRTRVWTTNIQITGCTGVVTRATQVHGRQRSQQAELTSERPCFTHKVKHDQRR